MDRLSPPIKCAPGTALELLISYMCPYGREIDISTSFFRTSGTKTAENPKISPWKRDPGKESGSNGDEQCVLLDAMSSHQIWVFHSL